MKAWSWPRDCSRTRRTTGRVWIALGQIDVRLRRWKDAEDAFDKADPLTTKKEDKTYMLFLRGELAERQKHFEPAEQFFRQALDLDPANAMTLNYLGYMLADKGIRLPEALKMIRKAVDLEPMNGAYLDSLGWVYFKMGNTSWPKTIFARRCSATRPIRPSTSTWAISTRRPAASARPPSNGSFRSTEYAKSLAADVEPGDVAKVQKKLDSARVKLASKDSALAPGNPSNSERPVASEERDIASN